MRNTGIAGLTAIAIALVAGVALANTGHSDPPAEPSRSEPSFRLMIPKINVDTTVESVGLTPFGAIDAPKDPVHAAWFNLGPRPGDIGSAIIDGHSGWKDNVPAVFDNLSVLQVGDKIFVEDAEGVATTFIVRELRTYGQHANADAVFRSSDGKAPYKGLNPFSGNPV